MEKEERGIRRRRPREGIRRKEEEGGRGKGGRRRRRGRREQEKGGSEAVRPVWTCSGDASAAHQRNTRNVHVVGVMGQGSGRGRSQTGVKCDLTSQQR